MFDFISDIIKGIDLDLSVKANDTVELKAKINKKKNTENKEKTNDIPLINGYDYILELNLKSSSCTKNN